MQGGNYQRTTRRRAVLRGLGAAGAAGLTGLAGCTGNTGDGGGGGGVNELKVGVTTSLSGPFAVFGRAGLHGAELAKADLEEELGVSIELLTGDTQVNPDTGLQRIQRLVTEENIDFAIGGVSSAVALAIGGWANENDVAYFPTGAHSDQITGGGCNPAMFRPTCSNSMLANTIGQEMASAADSWYLIYSDYTWGQTAQEAVARILENQGKTVVGRSAAPFPSDDYSQFLNRAQNSDADGIGLLIAGLDLRKAVNQLIDKGMRDQFTYAMHQLEDAVFWGLDKDKASILDAAGQVWGPGAPGGDDFKQRVADNYDTDPYVRHFLGYVALDQAVRAADRAGDTTPGALREALAGHEVTSPAKDIKGGGTMFWRECDNQLIQPTYSMEARSDMQDSPYKEWFSVKNTFAGEDVARSCGDTGCNL